MKMEDPTRNRLFSGTIAPSRSNNVAVHAGKAMSRAMAMPPPTIVPMSLGIRLFMECLPNDKPSPSRRKRATSEAGEEELSHRHPKQKGRRLSAQVKCNGRFHPAEFRRNRNESFWTFTLNQLRTRQLSK